MHGGINKFKVKILTPLHIGSGVEHNNFWDLHAGGDNRLSIIDVDKLMEDNVENKAFIENFGHGSLILSEFLSKHKIKAENLPELYNLPSACPASKVTTLRAFIKTCGNPYIPGSSLKGAIRTAILGDYCYCPKNKEEEVNRLYDWADSDKEVMKRFFGADPNCDLLRALQVGDTHFEKDSLSVYEAEVLTLNLKNQLNKKYSNYCECLSRDSASSGELRIKTDEYLFTERANEFGHRNDDGRKLLGERFEEIMRKAAVYHLENEIKFYEKYPCGPIIQSLQGLRSEINSVVNNSNIYLNLGWGIGWRGTTGDIIPDDLLDGIRKENKLGKVFCPSCKKTKIKEAKYRRDKYFCPDCKEEFPKTDLILHEVFPKSRKVVRLSKNSLAPMGWIKLEPVK